MTLWSQLLIVFIAWVLYFVSHSWLAANATKQFFIQRFHLNQRIYRLFYVILAFVLLLPLAYLVWTDSSPVLWRYQGWLKLGLDSVAVVALAGFFIVARCYDMVTFLGFATAKQNQGFKISWLHRYVRHPWYFLGLLIIWTRDMSALWLLSCLCITVYLIIGSRLEENKMIAEYGEAYRYYKQRVVGLFIVPGRYMDDEALRKLENLK